MLHWIAKEAAGTGTTAATAAVAIAYNSRTPSTHVRMNYSGPDGAGSPARNTPEADAFREQPGGERTRQAPTWEPPGPPRQRPRTAPSRCHGPQATASGTRANLKPGPAHGRSQWALCHRLGCWGRDEEARSGHASRRPRRRAGPLDQSLLGPLGPHPSRHSARSRSTEPGGLSAKLGRWAFGLAGGSDSDQARWRPASALHGALH